jgi:hypothetical protein
MQDQFSTLNPQPSTQALPDKLRELLEARMPDKCVGDAQGSAAHMQLAIAHAANLEIEGKAALVDQLRAEVLELTAKLRKSETARRVLHNQVRVRVRVVSLCV